MMQTLSKDDIDDEVPVRSIHKNIRGAAYFAQLKILNREQQWKQIIYRTDSCRKDRNTLTIELMNRMKPPAGRRLH